MIWYTNRQKSKSNIFNCTGSYAHSIIIYLQFVADVCSFKTTCTQPRVPRSGPRKKSRWTKPCGSWLSFLQPTTMCSLKKGCLGCKTGSTPLVIHLIFVCYGYAAKPKVPQSVSQPSQCGSKMDGVSHQKVCVVPVAVAVLNSRSDWHPYGLNFWHSPSKTRIFSMICLFS